MKIFSKTLEGYYFPIVLILVLSFSRLIPHPPNFTPIIAVAIMSSYFFKNIYISFATLLIAMLLADAFIGFYNNMLFIYLSLFLITFIFFKININISSKNLIIFGFFGSLIFYFISNFGVWVLGSPGVYDIAYEKNLDGLIQCYLLAIPFFKNTLISTLFYSYLGLFIFKPKYKFNFIRNI